MITSSAERRLSPISTDRLKAFCAGASWYHTIRVADGIATQGTFDHRPLLQQYRFPAMTGKSVLDVGAADGFFSFEFESRGARRVVTVDVNTFRDPREGATPVEPSARHILSYSSKYQVVFAKNKAFEDCYRALGVPCGHQLLATKALLNSDVEYKNLSVNELASLNQQFDFVFCGNLIEHLKNPLGALEQLALVTRERCTIVTSCWPLLRVRPANGVRDSWRWKVVRFLGRYLKVPVAHPSSVLAYEGNTSGGSFFRFAPETFRDAMLASGFAEVEIGDFFDLPQKGGESIPLVAYHGYVA